MGDIRFQSCVIHVPRYSQRWCWLTDHRCKHLTVRTSWSHPEIADNTRVPENTARRSTVRVCGTVLPRVYNMSQHTAVAAWQLLSEQPCTALRTFSSNPTPSTYTALLRVSTLVLVFPSWSTLVVKTDDWAFSFSFLRMARLLSPIRCS